eukprot:4108219-Ditylum_brightwellii.AAC.1
MQETCYLKGHCVQGRDFAKEGRQVVGCWEEILQRKEGELLVDGEVRTLSHSCKKPVSSKAIVSKEGILQRNEGKMLIDGKRKEGKLLVDREVRALSHSCKKPVTSKGIVSKEEILQKKEGKLLVAGKV